MKRRPIDFKLLREMVKVREVLGLLDWKGWRARNGDWRGPCPIHRSERVRSRIFDVCGGIAHCHYPKCNWKGDGLQLWADVHNMDKLEAAYDLCSRLGINPPLIPPKR